MSNLPGETSTTHTTNTSSGFTEVSSTSVNMYFRKMTKYDEIQVCGEVGFFPFVK